MSDVSSAPRALSRVAVLGAGVAGLSCARRLVDHGLAVTVLDKGLAPGGRLSGCRAEDLVADLGAPYFTVRDPRLAAAVAAWREAGVVATWEGRVLACPSTDASGRFSATPPLERLVGTPSMTAIARHLALGLDLRRGHRVDRITRDGPWLRLDGLTAPDGVTLPPAPPHGTPGDPLEPLGTYDAVLVCLPSDQAAPLLAPVAPALATAASGSPCDRCLALAFRASGAALREVPLDGLFIGRDGDPDRVLSWLVRDGSKPGRRADLDCWVAHADARWSRAHLRTPEADVTAAMLAEVARVLGVPSLRADASLLRRWAFARTSAVALPEPLLDDELRLGAAGDWVAGGRVEGAFLAGLTLADRLLATTTPRRGA